MKIRSLTYFFLKLKNSSTIVVQQYTINSLSFQIEEFLRHWVNVNLSFSKLNSTIYILHVYFTCCCKTLKLSKKCWFIYYYKYTIHNAISLRNTLKRNIRTLRDNLVHCIKYKHENYNENKNHESNIVWPLIPFFIDFRVSFLAPYCYCKTLEYIEFIMHIDSYEKWFKIILRPL